MKIASFSIKNSNKNTCEKHIKNSIFLALKQYKKQVFITVFLFFLTALFIIDSNKYLTVVVNGILLYGTKVLPSLLPFFFITKILSNFDFIYLVCNQFSSLTKLLFNTKSISCYIFFMSIISGYPVGAKLTSEFYENNLINEKDAQKILSFSSTSGPLFIIGTVGIGFFHSKKIGILLLLVHILSSVLNGILYRNIGKNDINNRHLFSKNTLKIQKNYKENVSKNQIEYNQNDITTQIDCCNNNYINNQNIYNNSYINNQIFCDKDYIINQKKFNENDNNNNNYLKYSTFKNFSLQDCMMSSINSVLVVGGFIVVFYVLINILLDYNILYPLVKLLQLLGLNSVEANGFASGLIEITTGLSILAQSENLVLPFILSNFLISFSGISILMQATAFLEKCNVNKWFYILQKLTHGIISAILSIVIALIFF